MNEDFQLISLWLGRQKDFQSGVEIYERLGSNYALKAKFRGGETSLRLELLEKAMQDLLIEIGKKDAPALTKTELKAEAREYQIETIHNVRPSDLPNAPEAVKAVRTKRRNLFDEFKRCHALLNFNTPKDERIIICLRIPEIREEIDACWRFTNYYDTNLKIPAKEESKTIEDLNVIEANKRYEANYKYVNKYKAKEDKQSECMRRIEENQQLKQKLEQDGAFFHAGYIMSDFAEK